MVIISNTRGNDRSGFPVFPTGCVKVKTCQYTSILHLNKRHSWPEGWAERGLLHTVVEFGLSTSVLETT